VNEIDAMRLLAEANPVRAEDLGGFSLPDSVLAGRRPRRRFVLATAVLAGAIAASLIGAFAFGGSPKQQSGGARSSEPLPTLAHPLPHPDAKEITLSDARQVLGAQIVLPDNSLASPSEIGAVWTQRTGPVVDVAVTFPRSGLIVNYERPIRYPQPVPQMYETEAKQSPDSMSVIDLDGVPALATLQNSDQLHQNFGAIEFVENGTVVSVLGHYETATLQAVAQSIVDQEPSAPPTNDLIPPGAVPVKHLRLRDASATFGAPVVLPDPLLVARRGARVTAFGTCPPGSRRAVVDERGCAIYISLPRSALNLVYERALAWRPRLWRPTPSVQPFDLDGVRAAEFRATRFSINPADWVLTFAIGETRVEVSGDHDLVRAVARSIIDRSK